MKNSNKFEFHFNFGIFVSFITILIHGCASQEPINLKLSNISNKEKVQSDKIVDNANYIKSINIFDYRENKDFLGNTYVPISCNNVIDWAEDKFENIKKIPLNNHLTKKSSDATGFKLDIYLKKAECICSYLNLRCSLGFEANLIAEKNIVFSEFLFGSYVKEKTIMSGGYCNFNVDEINSTMNMAMDIVIIKLHNKIE